MDIELTKEEAEVLVDYLARKCVRLAESGLTDSRCYPLLLSVHNKIAKEIRNNDK